MALIRALTLMLPHAVSFESLKGKVFRLKQAAKLLGNEVWTLRISIGAELSRRELGFLIDEGLLINSYHEILHKVDLRKLINYLSFKNTYAALKLEYRNSPDYEASKVFRVLMSVKGDLGIEALTRVGFLIGDEVGTPYFPLSYPLKGGVSVALRFADTLTKTPTEDYVGVIRNLLIAYESRIKSVLDKVSLRYLGIDASLSPWMDESVIPIIAKLSKTSFPNPGTAYGVKKINDVIWNALKRSEILTTGFNEVMLPVGEDNMLKDLVRRGQVRLEHLTFLTSYCVAGVDMVVIDDNEAIIDGVIKDLIAAYLLKKRPVGLRLIPSDKDEVGIPNLGSIPKVRAGLRRE